MSWHVAVFAKAPIAGLAKTRLVPLLGEEGAAAAHRRMTVHALQGACAAAPGQVSLWSAGDHDHPFLRECGVRFDIAQHRQPDGDLGQRMAACLQTLLRTHARVLLIGSDCPALMPADLQRAGQALHDGARMVFTPADDGGYVLVGMAKTAGDIAAAAFAHIDWSTPAVMQQTRERLAGIGWTAGRDWAEMPLRWDVDTPADYQRAVRSGLLTACD